MRLLRRGQELGDPSGGDRREGISALIWAAVPPDVLNLSLTLKSGQAFRWIETPVGEWAGAIGAAVLRLRPEKDGFWWQTYPAPDRWDLVERYFALDVDLGSLERDWLVRDPGLAAVIAPHRGLRILRQQPEEVFFAFVCACCNTVTKIERSVRALAEMYGEPLAEVGGRSLFRFPSLERLVGASESALRANLWGFRAPRVPLLARAVLRRGEDWLPGLARRPYEEARAELAQLPGIGLKIADCICAFGLGFDEAAPLDTHVWKCIVRRYRSELQGKTLTARRYIEASEAFRRQFGPYSGWLQQYLFLNEMTARRGSTKV